MRVAAKHLGRDRRALLVAQQADDDLFFALLAVAVVAVGPVGIVLAFEVTAGHVVEKQIQFVLPAPLGEQPFFNGPLVCAQPGEVDIAIVLVEAALEPEHVAGRMDLRQAYGGQTRTLLQHAGQNLPQRQLGGEAGAERLVDAQPPGRLADGPDSSDRESLRQLDCVERTEGRKVALALQGEFDGGDRFGIAMGEVGDVAFADVVAVAEGLAEVDGLVGLAVGGGSGGAGNVHVHRIRHSYNKYNRYSLIMHVYSLQGKIVPRPLTPQGLPQNVRGEHPVNDNLAELSQ